MSLYDTDDTAGQYPLISNTGVVTTTQANFSIISQPGGLPSWRNWQNTSYTDTNNYLANLGNFVSYARARKTINTITNISQMQSNTINLFNGNLTVNNANLLPNVNNAVLIVLGNFSINPTNALPAAETFNPAQNSLAFIATGTLGFDSKYTLANGIFIASAIDFALNHTAPSEAATELKINGNVISRNAVTTIDRKRADSTKPTLFVVVKPKMYFDLLPYLSTIVQEGRQLQ